MKVFEEWQNQRVIKPKRFINPVEYYCFGEKEGWRAAFEKIDSWMRLASGQVVNEVKTRIKKELEGE